VTETIAENADVTTILDGGVVRKRAGRDATRTVWRITR